VLILNTEDTMIEVQFIPLDWVEMAAYAAARGEQMVVYSYRKLVDRRSIPDRRVEPAGDRLASRRAA